jgi:hypothetical protein
MDERGGRKKPESGDRKPERRKGGRGKAEGERAEGRNRKSESGNRRGGRKKPESEDRKPERWTEKKIGKRTPEWRDDERKYLVGPELARGLDRPGEDVVVALKAGS